MPRPIDKNEKRQEKNPSLCPFDFKLLNLNSERKKDKL